MAYGLRNSWKPETDGKRAAILKTIAAAEATNDMDHEKVPEQVVEAIPPASQHDGASGNDPGETTPSSSSPNGQSTGTSAVAADSASHPSHEQPQPAPVLIAVMPPSTTSSASTGKPTQPANAQNQTSWQKVRLWCEQSMFWPWRWELFAAVLALGLLFCEIALLVHYDKKFPEQDWPHTWSINSVFAFLTTFLEVAVMFYVGACLGQLRWYWFKRSQHRLDWLEILTESRSPSGAMRMLFRSARGRKRQFAVLGALIVIGLLGVNTFTQQVIIQVTNPFRLGLRSAWVPINRKYESYDQGSSLRAGAQQPVPQMVAAIESGFYSYSSREKSLGVTAWTQCNGAKCEFGVYSSIAVCSRCADISSQIVNPCPNGGCTDDDYFTLKNGVDLSLAAKNGAVNLTADTKLPSDAALSAEVGPMIVRFHVMARSDTKNGTQGPPAAQECAAYWCVKTYSGKVVNSTLEESLLSEWTDTSVAARTSYPQVSDIHMTPRDCYIDIYEHPASCTFVAGAYATIALQDFLAVQSDLSPVPPFLSGSATSHIENGGTLWDYTGLAALGLVSDSSTKYAVIYKATHGFTKMAEYMTASIRGEPTPSGSSLYSYGYSEIYLQQFHVRWGWLAFPISIVTISLAFFIGTMILSRHHEIWKTSILPIVFHSFSGVDQEKFVKLDTVEAMQLASRGQKVYLGSDGGGHAIFKTGATAKVSEYESTTSGAASGTAHVGTAFLEAFNNA